ncbi:hypothetical protein M441DRAFT_401654 [Trichoderma asperellum CBS 433.97]|uniref:Uncharacterized protein n=1 Tax=Trichoderma asperellum (strain ATCC 204424 / CBS 433.97 / NBRC 101777) TaxID=1042311 RepID=A0A2T3Z9Z6_TRIA4|nr:hypothetical protein M441DRAFT_401654 [Trichoderma asperellum CBS 433.97]PTB41610.1 hypothetical protein M441DRAFT_401654 [Trichoderma asperellum CBS 433.97]
MDQYVPYMTQHQSAGRTRSKYVLHSHFVGLLLLGYPDFSHFIASWSSLFTLLPSQSTRWSISLCCIMQFTNLECHTILSPFLNPSFATSDCSFALLTIPAARLDSSNLISSTRRSLGRIPSKAVFISSKFIVSPFIISGSAPWQAFLQPNRVDTRTSL